MRMRTRMRVRTRLTLPRTGGVSPSRAVSMSRSAIRNGRSLDAIRSGWRPWATRPRVPATRGLCATRAPRPESS
eukprot:scaffold65392_cov47-Phaeocystis_antarctica.AAC.2